MDSTLFCIKKCLSNRQNSNLDQDQLMNFEFSEETLTTKPAMANKESYLENYVQDLQVPSLYVMDSKINKKF